MEFLVGMAGTREPEVQELEPSPLPERSLVPVTHPLPSCTNHLHPLTQLLPLTGRNRPRAHVRLHDKASSVLADFKPISDIKPVFQIRCQTPTALRAAHLLHAAHSSRPR